METQRLDIKSVIGQGYEEFWRSTKRYVVCKGSRGSKKSVTAALKLIVRLMQYPLANALVIRQTASTLKNSCYAQLKWAINRLGVGAYWKCTVNPLQITYLPTGQKILFYGLDNAFKLTSITVEKGYLCFAWAEEAFEISEKDFETIDESLRGIMPEGYYIQWLITFNPIDASSWLKAKFFDKPSENVLAMTTTYKINEWLSEKDFEMFEEMKKTDPERYKVRGLGDWGIAEGQYFKQWNTSKHIVEPFKIPEGWAKFRAMDWGQAKPYCCLWFAVDYDGNLYCYRELYGWEGKPNVGTGETAKEVAEKICKLEKRSEKVQGGVLDNACWARTGVTGPTIEEEINLTLIKHKLIPFSKCSKGRVEGANAFKQRLIGNEMKDGKFKPAIYFFKTCYNCLRTIPMLGHDKHNPETYDSSGEDHCFVAGTLITTKRGDIPIEEVTTADFVLTRKGFKKVLVAGLTKKNAEVMTVEFSNGKCLTGTKNHPIFIKGKGFCTLDTIKYGDIIYSVSEVKELCHENNQKQQIQSCSTELNSGVIQIQNELVIGNIIEQVEAIASKVSAICIEKFGNSIMEKFLKDTTSTIKTEIFSTMIFQILNYLKVSTIYHNTQKKIMLMKILEIMPENIWKLLEKKLLNGTGQRKDENGIDNTPLNVQKKKLKNQKLYAFVSNAERNLKHQVTEGIKANIVQKPVVQNTGAIKELTTKREFVQSVEKNIALTDSKNKKLVEVKNVVFAVCLTTEKRKADVYNLTVDEEHEYFANGFLVHNCADAVVYACLSRPFAPIKAKVKRGDYDAYSDDEPKRSNWTY